MSEDVSLSPIRPENVGRYPDNWLEIRKKILTRADHRCEQCGVPDRTYRDNGDGHVAFIILTIAHLDHTPENCHPDNLRALCQRCHNRLDAPVRAANRKKRLAKEAGQLDLQM